MVKLVVGLAAVVVGAGVAAGGSVTRVSVATDGTQGNAGAYGAVSISSDGRFVVFASDATNLVSPHIPTSRIFVHDRMSGETTRLLGTVVPNHPELYNAQISGNGRYVVFDSRASNLVPNDTNGAPDIFVHDRDTGLTTRESVGYLGQVNGDNGNASISADGRYVAFSSSSLGLVPNAGWPNTDVFIRDRLLGTTGRLNVFSPNEVEGYGFSSPAISADGSSIVFYASWITFTPPNVYQTFQAVVRADRAGGNVQMFGPVSGGSVTGISSDGSHIAFAETVSTATAAYGNLVIHGPNGRQLVVYLPPGYSGSAPRLTADNRYAAFSAPDNNLYPGDNNSLHDVFLYDSTEDRIDLMSVGGNGARGNAHSLWPDISADGRFVVFTSAASNLVQDDTNGVSDIFVVDRGEQCPEKLALGKECESDIDGDGLFDEWEEKGIPYVDVNGEEQRYDLPGAKKDRRDLYVEVDAMEGQLLDGTAREMVIAAFRNAPLQNPDGSWGIILHIDQEEDDLPRIENWQTDGCWPLDFDNWKLNSFGSPTERGDPRGAPLLEAKAKAYRYCIIGVKSSPKGVAGCGEWPGDNFVCFFEDLGSDEYGQNEMAATFMHELGHNLGLGHGGSDDINGKPNYPSIMNYVLCARTPSNARFWRLDFSRVGLGEGFDVLDENCLDEAAGIGFSASFYRNFILPYGINARKGAQTIRQLLWAPLDGRSRDFGNLLGTGFIDGVFTSPCVIQDLNYVADPPPNYNIPTTPSPGQPLIPFNDWANIRMKTRSARGAAAPAPAYPSNEMTTEGRRWMAEHFPIPPALCPGDANGDMLVDGRDLSVLLGQFGTAIARNTGADFNANGSVSGADLSVLLTNYGNDCRDLDFDHYGVSDGDCDDANALVNPGVSEICGNGIDDDCDGLVDQDDPDCIDDDADGWTIGEGDCDDSQPGINPGALEVCGNGIDDNCNGLADSADPWCAPGTDFDEDGWTIENGDCDDNNPAVNPGAPEQCFDFIDNDCDGEFDEKGCQ